MEEGLRFRVLGELAVQRVTGGVATDLELGGPRPRRLLAALLLSLGEPLAPDRLVELVWGDEAPASARGSLQAYISTLRRVLDPGGAKGRVSRIITLRPGGYQLEVDRSQLDVGAFEAAASAGAVELDRGRPAEAIELLQTALVAWAPLLAEMGDVPFVRAEAVRLAARQATAFELLQTARLAVGDHHSAIAELRRSVALDPRAERLWALLALARYRSGHPADAIATVHAARAALEDCGLPLGPELRSLEADLYAHAVDLGPAIDRVKAAAPAADDAPDAAPSTRSRTRRCRRPVPAGRAHR